jgi:hypothetical protein
MRDLHIQRKSLDLMEQQKYKNLLKAEMTRELHEDPLPDSSVATMIQFMQRYKSNQTSKKQTMINQQIAPRAIIKM